MPTKNPTSPGNTAKKGKQSADRSKADRKKATSAVKPQEAAAQTGKSNGSSASGGNSARWTFFTNHAHVLICLYQDSEIVLRDIANRVGITERAVQRIVQELEEAGFVERERVGRRNHYIVSRDGHLRHPIEEHCTVDALFGVILNKD